MGSREKGKLRMHCSGCPLRRPTCFVPESFQRLHGIRSKTKLYQSIYTVIGPLLPALKKLFPTFVTTTENVGRAMLKVAKTGSPKRVLDNADINSLVVWRNAVYGIPGCVSRPRKYTRSMSSVTNIVLVIKQNYFSKGCQLGKCTA